MGLRISSVITLLLCLNIGLSAQNLLFNPDFSIKESCPLALNQLTTVNWISNTLGTPDYFNTCSTNNTTGIPWNNFGWQDSGYGDAYVGLVTKDNNATNYREYIHQEFNDSIPPGCYEFSIILSPADYAAFGDHIGIHFSDFQFVNVLTSFYGFEPTLEITDLLMEIPYWKEYKFEFYLDKAIKFITIGNMRFDEECTAKGGFGAFADQFSYLYIDYVSLIAKDGPPNIDVDLGPDLSVCQFDYPYALSSNIVDGIYLWNNGDINDSLIIDGPGMYTLTVFDNCMSKTDTIYVDTYQIPLYDLDPLYDLCFEDTIYMILDDSYGTYEWGDGSDAIFYQITEPGTYYTTLTHFCGTIEDSFEVQLLLQPEIIPLDNLFACQEDLPLLVSASYLNTGYNDFYWSNGASADSAFINNGGDFFLQVSNSCFSDIAEFHVDLNVNLPLSIPFEDSLVCDDEYFIILTTIHGNEYEWQDGSSDWAYLGQGPGLYSVTISNSCDTSIYEFEAKPYPAPEFEVEDSISICQGDEVVLNSGITAEMLEEEMWTLEWSTGETKDSITVQSAGTYYLSVTNKCETVVDSIILAYQGIGPDIYFSENITICEGAVTNITPESGGILYEYEWSTGSVADTIVAANEGWYYVTATNNCGQDIDSVYVLIDGQVPSLNIPASASICEGDLFMYDLPANDYTIEWSDGTPGDHFEIGQAGIYTVSAENICGITMDTIQINVIPEFPKPDLGNDIALCAMSNTSLTVSEPDVDILWSTGEVVSNISISAPGEYWVEYSNACFTKADTIIILDGGTIPQIELGPDLLICEGDSVLLEVLDISIDSILWSNGSNTSTQWINDAEIITVWTSNACGISIDTVEIEVFDDVLNVDLGNDQELCIGDTITLDIGSVPGTIAWNTGADVSMIQITTPGVYSVLVDSYCGTSEDSIEIIDDGFSPNFELGNDIYICPNESIELYIDPSLGNIEWSTGASDSTIDVSQQTTISAIVSNNCGIAYDTISVFVNDGPPVVDLGVDQSICIGDSVEIILNPGLGSVEWSDGTIGDTIVINDVGTYTAIVSTNCGSNSDSILISWNDPEPTVDLGIDLYFCAGDTIDLLVDGSQGDISWNNGSEENSIEITQAGEVSVIIENICGIAYDTIQVFENVGPPVVDLGLDQNICEGDSIILTLNIPNGTIEWNDGSSADSLIVDGVGWYYATVSTLCGSNVDSVEISWKEAIPPVNLGLDQIICEGDSVLLNPGLGNAVSYNWNTLDTDEQIYASDEGTYWLEIANDCGSAVDSVEISYEAAIPAWSLGLDTTICDGDEIQLQSNITTNNLSFNWNTGADDETINISDDGTYWLEISNPCASVFDSIEIFFHPPVPTLSLGIDQVICEGDSIVLDADVGSNYSYSWNTGADEAVITVFDAGNYEVEVSNLCETQIGNMLLAYDLSSFEFDIEDPIVACNNEYVQINVTQNFNTTYLWEDGSDSPTFGSTDAGNFKVELAATCTDTIVEFIIERKYCDDERMFIPNIFSPNGDGVNDFFSFGYYDSFDVQEFNIRIFDRWGNEVFTSEDSNFQWDGTMGGADLMLGVYTFVVQLVYNSEDGPESFSTFGDITLMK